MHTSISLGKFLGIPIKIHLNWFITAVLVTWSLSAGYFPYEFPGWQPSMYWVAGLITSLFFFGSVLAHELAHAVVAQHEGIRVQDITLFILGGLANITEEPETPISEFRIVAAGPLMSLILSVLLLIGFLVTGFSRELSSVALYLSEVNLLLAIFNLIPGLPLDGGRILRSMLWNWLGDFNKATRWGSIAGLFFGLGIITAGVVLMLSRNYFAGLWIAFIGWYLATAAQTSYRQSMEETQSINVTVPGRIREQQPVLQSERINKPFG